MSLPCTQKSTTVQQHDKLLSSLECCHLWQTKTRRSGLRLKTVVKNYFGKRVCEEIECVGLVESGGTMLCYRHHQNSRQQFLRPKKWTVYKPFPQQFAHNLGISMNAEATQTHSDSNHIVFIVIYNTTVNPSRRRQVQYLCLIKARLGLSLPFA